MSELMPEGGITPVETPVEPVEPAVEPEEQAWQGPTQEEWEQTQQIVQMVAQAAQPPTQELPGAQFDAFAENADEQVRQIAREEYARVVAERESVEEGNARAADIITDLQTSKGEFLLPDSKDHALTEAQNLLPQFIQKFGNTAKAAEAAIEAAYENTKTYEQALGKAYHERQMNQLQGLRNAPREMPVTAAAGQQLTDGGTHGKSLTDLVSQHFSRPG